MDKGMCADRQPSPADWLQAYRPLQITPNEWVSVRPFVVGLANRLGPDGGAGAIRTVRVLARLAAWAVGEGLTLDAEVVLDPDTVERFITVGVADDRSRATYRATLRRVGPVLTRKAPWEAKAAPVARRSVALPYTDRELESLRVAARVAADDVSERNGVVLLGVGEPASRVVPVHTCWEHEVLDLAATAGGDFLVGGRSTARNRAGALAASLVVGNARPRFSASRLRSTWLVTYLAMGTRLPELAQAAGLQGVTVLSDLLSFVPALDDDESHKLLRGAR